LADAKWLNEKVLGDEPDINCVIREGPLVAGSFFASLVFAMLTAAALVSALVGVVLIAVTRALGPPSATDKKRPDS
jgi:hypothetical protein